MTAEVTFMFDLSVPESGSEHDSTSGSKYSLDGVVKFLQGRLSKWCFPDSRKKIIIPEKTAGSNVLIFLSVKAFISFSFLPKCWNSCFVFQNTIHYPE